MPTLFGRQLDETGSNIEALSRHFTDPTGAALRVALSRAFAYAEAAAADSKTKQEAWDRAMQEEFSRLAEEDGLMTSDARLLLEKTHGGNAVWDCGVRVFTTQVGRMWTLPDGLIRAAGETVALELDHGKSLGDWAGKLLKAIRCCASPKTAGVLFCYCTTADQSTWFAEGDFTSEFRYIIETGLDNDVGIITIGSADLARVKRAPAVQPAFRAGAAT